MQGIEAEKKAEIFLCGPVAGTVRSGNTDGASSQLAFSGGLDTLNCSLYVDWRGRMTTCRSRLEAAVRSAREGGPAIVEGPEGEAFTVRQHGFPYGRSFMEWVVQTDVGVLGLSRDFEHKEGKPNAVVQIGSVPLMQYGHRGCWQLLKRVIAGWGGSVRRAVPVRADLCVDVVGFHVSEVDRARLQGCYICQSGKNSHWREWDHVETVYFGTGKSVYARFYDKRREALNGDERKLEVVKTERWGGVVPEVATRFEYQVAGDVLKDRFTIEDLEGLFVKLPEVADYLTHDWLRFTRRPVDRRNKNHQRASVADWWETIRGGFRTTFGEAGGERVPRAKSVPQPVRLERTTLGTLCSLMARTCGGELLSTRDEVMERAVSWLREKLPQNAADRINRRMDELANRLPLACVQLAGEPF